ncbi:hypothetical protein H8356DRAFT_1328194 [Neocallimastix lanati (nom. inval.)]|nr:hypothetical protein H8356DRAFT_1328194 [Neocallimastix sp. JGI-2020a]
MHTKYISICNKNIRVCKFTYKIRSKIVLKGKRVAKKKKKKHKPLWSVNPTSYSECQFKNNYISDIKFEKDFNVILTDEDIYKMKKRRKKNKSIVIFNHHSLINIRKFLYLAFVALVLYHHFKESSQLKTNKEYKYKQITIIFT